MKIKNNHIATDKDSLREIIRNEIKLHGKKCNLNHIDVSQVTDMSFLFCNSPFAGDISLWNVSKVTNMASMFQSSKFNGDISRWEVDNVTDMNYMFLDSQFTGDITDWTPYKLKEIGGMFQDCQMNIPYWYDKEDIKKTIESYILSQKLNGDLVNKMSSKKKIKKK